MKLKGVNRARATAGAGAEQQTGQGGISMSQESNVPATQGANALAPQASGGSIQELNRGVLENIDDWNDSVSYVSFENTGGFTFKESGETVNELDVLIVRGERIYQKYDEELGKYITEKTKVDDSYKLKFNIWFVLADDDVDENEEVTQYKLTLPTASTMVFLRYADRLAKAGYAVNQVRTKMTWTRQENKQKQKFARAAFEAFDLETGAPLNIKHG